MLYLFQNIKYKYLLQSERSHLVINKICICLIFFYNSINDETKLLLNSNVKESKFLNFQR